MMRNIPMKLFILCIAVLTVSVCAENTVQKQPFSVSALKYLLDRKEYDRFDFYMGSYLRQHPDTAVLYLLKGHRYFKEAMQHQEKRIVRRSYSSGGIPRKYPAYLMMTPQVHETSFVTIEYNTPLIDTSFIATRRAREIEPDRIEIYWTLIRMAIEANRPDLLGYEVKLFVDHFGQSDSLRNSVISYARSEGVPSQSSDMIQLLGALFAWYPDNVDILTELGKYYYRAGKTDSAYHFYTRASTDEDKTIKMIEQNVRLASCNGRFSQACSLSLNIYALSKNLLHLELAAVFALAFDSVYAAKLHNDITSSPGYADSLSITSTLFTREYLMGRRKLKQKYFSGDLFYLNFPLFEVRYNRSRDRVAYFQDKAGAFFAFGMHDSSAYYNLNLLRTLSHKDKRGESVLFNLAAEYYAAGKYRLSYYRFLDMCRFYKGKSDAAVRYALGLNCEQFGDFTNAKRHYRWVAKYSSKKYNEEYQLQHHAQNRLKDLQKDNLISFKEENQILLKEIK